MRRKFNICIYLKTNRLNTDGEHPIYIRITVDKKRAELSTGKTCLKEEWNSKGQLLGMTQKAKAINSYLQLLLLKIHRAHLDLIHEDADITAVAISNKFLGKEPETKLLLKILQSHNENMKVLVGNKFSPFTLMRYQTLYRNISMFLALRYHLDDISINKLDYAFISDYDTYLRLERKCSNNTAAKYIKQLKKIMGICVANGWLPRNPFFGYKTKIIVTERIFLEQAELNSLISLNLSSQRLDTVRDVFVFCSYTGLAYIDVFNLRRSDVTKSSDNNLWLNIKRKKTGARIRLPLLPKAAEIFLKYEDYPICSIKNKALPVNTNQKMNAYLKELAALCHIHKRITFHMARHTFATTITLSNDVPLETVSRMLGHTDIRTTQHYAKIVDRRIEVDMAILKQKLEKQEKIMSSALDG